MPRITRDTSRNTTTTAITGNNSLGKNGDINGVIRVMRGQYGGYCNRLLVYYWYITGILLVYYWYIRVSDVLPMIRIVL